MSEARPSWKGLRFSMLIQIDITHILQSKYEVMLYEKIHICLIELVFDLSTLF